MATKKSAQLTALLKNVELPGGIPKLLEEKSLLESGMYLVLLKHMAASRAESALKSLCKHFEDLNEARVSQVQEISDLLSPRSKGRVKSPQVVAAAKAIKEFLQTVFQNTHGLDLAILRDDLTAGAKLLSDREVLGAEMTSYLMMVVDGEQPVNAHIVRALDRLGIITRTTSLRKAREALGLVVPKGRELEFGLVAGRVADSWCDSRKPLCWECPMVELCVLGQKTRKEWQAQQARLKIQREKEEKRRIAADKREAQRLEREAKRQAEKDRKVREVAAKTLERERARLKRRREKEAAVKKAAAKKVAAKKAAEDKRKAVAKKKAAAAAAKKRAAARKKATKKKATKKKAAKKKASRRRTENPGRVAGGRGGGRR